MQFNNIASIIFALAAANVGLASPAARLAPNLQSRSCDCSCNADCATDCANGFALNPVGQGLCIQTCADSCGCGSNTICCEDGSSCDGSGCFHHRRLTLPQFPSRGCFHRGHWLCRRGQPYVDLIRARRVKAFCVATKRAEYARITAAPDVQIYSEENDGASSYQFCIFSGSTESTCVETAVTSSGTYYEKTEDIVTYVPEPPALRGQENIFTFPGLQPVLITSGANKLAGAATATGDATTGGGASNTGSSATVTGGGTLTSGSRSSTATNNAAAKAARKLSLGFVALAALVVNA
ncbi:hypothetical protein SUNI508_09992 [Seiridium unicorne]|uniref:GPI anchored protein n=1 Tax=Seiridium unicorne TaxID=138068 RepID=A0ABR2UMJ7_9PEZI